MNVSLNAVLAASALAGSAAVAATPDPGAGYPNRPIRIIVAYTPAGTTDILARALGHRIVGLGAQPIGGTPKEYAAFIKAEIAKWAKVIRDAGVKAE